VSLKITSHRDLEVYMRALEAAMRIFELSKAFPKEEMYSLTDQIRRSSRSVCSNIAEAWRKRRYQAAFVSKLNDAEMEAAETQCWLEFAVRCNYLGREAGKDLYQTYDGIISTLVRNGQPPRILDPTFCPPVSRFATPSPLHPFTPSPLPSPRAPRHSCGRAFGPRAGTAAHPDAVSPWVVRVPVVRVEVFFDAPRAQLFAPPRILVQDVVDLVPHAGARVIAHRGDVALDRHVPRRAARA
jgi:four helix bundle protein